MTILKINLKKLFLISFFLMPYSLIAENLILKSYGHSNFLIKGNEETILINPFKATGCAENLRETRNIKADFILASSRLADEGYNPNNDLMFVDPGTYQINNIFLTGISIPHDRFNGRRFGMSTVWTWEQSDFKIVHMAGAAGEITKEDQIILSRPDILFISIGGGNKSYDGKEASEIVEKLQPKIVIPVHYLKGKEFIQNCDYSNSDLFIKNMPDYEVLYVGKKIKFNSKRLNKKLIVIFK